ncbi:hypothetical protein Pse7367_3089 [Thalassoporum mexicanum PCC 7367]|uniref:hypothetical protein n=1 Tax=Thalassoporum mexicanum TaxID=3457544 RepID=UPI00029F848A|nr:hypothetical protein [Pseudanabaena sp. PCC 7367]AFY71338.1 hypothetical protein Pse7367_3089 [Pseudanabaena sp. PCC 7367]
MLARIFGVLAIVLALVTIFAAFTQTSALVLRQNNQRMYWSRHNTRRSGIYVVGRGWQPSPLRTDYSTFRGGGPRAGK